MNEIIKANDKKLSSVMTSMDEFFAGLSKESPRIFCRDLVRRVRV